ncbi:endo-1,4-beta-xylanase [Uliginosibacterium aquaticum]|nr:endo-1,4-beta-xylanase [Uliginosibacterium aquaticum]
MGCLFYSAQASALGGSDTWERRLAGRVGASIQESLTEILRRRGLCFGSSIDMEALQDPEYALLLRHHCGVFTTDLNMKFGQLRPRVDVLDYRKADALVNFAAEAGVPLRGHTLVWNEGLPEWAKGLSHQEAAYWMERHIDEVAGRYAGRMHSWDVVNEPFWPDHREAGGYRKGVWYNAMGPGYIARAFRAAAKADPKARLCLNEAWVERATPMADKVRQGLLRTVRELLDAGVRIDAVGLQCHLNPGPSLRLDVLSDFITELDEFPVDVYITELDVQDGMLRKTLANPDEFVGDLYGRFARTVLAHRNVKLISCWQLSDKYSGIRKEGSAVKPLPFDQDMQPNPAYYALRDAFLAIR